MSPQISIITPLFNSARFVGAAVRSVLAQSFADFEHVIVDDGSTDGSAEMVEELHDDRIRLVRGAHQGSAETYNRCLELARGDYIAVLDHDDLMHHERLATQLAFLDAHPEIDILGTGYRIIDEAGAPIATRIAPAGAATLRRMQLTFNAVAHPTVMYRRTVLRDVPWYRAEWFPAHDSEFLTRLSLTHGIDNIPEALTDWRRVASSPTAVRGREQMRLHYDMRREILEARLCDAPGPAERAECMTLLGKLDYYDSRGARALRWFAAAMRVRKPDAELIRYFAGALAFPVVRLLRALGIAHWINRHVRGLDAKGRYFAQ